MDFSFTEEQNMLRESVRKMLDRIATPAYVRAMDEEARYPYEVYDAIVEMGLISMVFPEQYGGLGGNVIDFVIIAEELGRKSYDLMGAYGTSVFNGLNLLHNGSEAQKRHYLPKLMAGEIRMSISMTEPDAGSDAGAMRTFARREGDEWVINGQKVFSTGAGAKNNIISLYAKTDNSVHYRKGISLFLVDNTLPGIRLRKLDTLGRRSLGTYEVFFDNVRIPADCIVGEPNRGWDYMLSGLQLERLMTTAAYCGAAQDVVDQALAYAKERKQFGKPIIEYQAVAFRLADMAIRIEAAEQYVFHVAELRDLGHPCLKEASMAKVLATEMAEKVCSDAIQTLGGYGYLADFPLERIYRDVRACQIYEGTSDIQRLVISRVLAQQGEI